MKFDKLLRTRDFDVDYRWIYRPDYLDKEMEEKLQFLTRKIMYKQELSEYLTRESLKNIYYLFGRKGSLLVRSGFSASLDAQARKIYSVEGIACSGKQNKKFWYALPYLIDYMLASDLLRDQWMEEGGRLPEIEFASLREDMLYEAPDLYILNHSDSIHRLIKDIHDADQMEDFVYGTRAAAFYDMPIRRYYTPSEWMETPPVAGISEWEKIDPSIRQKDVVSRMMLEMEPVKKRYALRLVARDGNQQPIAQTEEIYFNTNGIDLSQIENARLNVIERLREFGYGSKRNQAEEGNGRYE